MHGDLVMWSCGGILVEQVVVHGNEEKRLKGEIERLGKREVRLQQQVGISSARSLDPFGLERGI